MNKLTILARKMPAPPGSPRPYCLMPSDDLSADAIAHIPLGQDVAVSIKRGRSLSQHRLFWAILSHVAEATQWETAERLLVALKVRLGRYDLMKLPNGKVVPVPHSISFAAMPQDDFQRFFDDALRLICEEVIPGTDSAYLVAEVASLIGTSTGALESERAA